MSQSKGGGTEGRAPGPSLQLTQELCNCIPMERPSRNYSLIFVLIFVNASFRCRAAPLQQPAESRALGSTLLPSRSLGSQPHPDNALLHRFSTPAYAQVMAVQRQQIIRENGYKNEVKCSSLCSLAGTSDKPPRDLQSCLAPSSVLLPC